MPARKITIDKCTNCLPYAAIAPRTVTGVVAADDASDEEKDQADYICDAVDDKVEIQAALDAVPATGGTVLLLGHQFDLGSTDYDEDALLISNPHTVLHSPTFATIAANVLYGGYLVDIAADYVKLSNLKVHQTGTEDDEQGDAIGFATDIVNPVLDSLEVYAEAGYYGLYTKAGVVDAIIDKCTFADTLKSRDSTNTNWRILNCSLTKLQVKGDKNIVMNNALSDILQIYGDYCTVQGNQGTRISLNGNYNYAIANVLIGAGEYDGIYLQGNYNNAIDNYVDDAGNAIHVKSGDQCSLFGNA